MILGDKDVALILRDDGSCFVETSSAAPLTAHACPALLTAMALASILQRKQSEFVGYEDLFSTILAQEMKNILLQEEQNENEIKTE